MQDYNVRSLEIDVWDDPEGGRFECNPVARIVGVTPLLDSDPVMDEPGFKVRFQSCPFTFQSTVTFERWWMLLCPLFNAVSGVLFPPAVCSRFLSCLNIVCIEEVDR